MCVKPGALLYFYSRRFLLFFFCWRRRSRWLDGEKVISCLIKDSQVLLRWNIKDKKYNKSFLMLKYLIKAIYKLGFIVLCYSCRYRRGSWLCESRYLFGILQKRGSHILEISVNNTHLLIQIKKYDKCMIMLMKW